MKILQICAYAGPYEGNFMKSLYTLEKNMLNYGYETIYAFPESIKDNEWVKKLVAKKERKKERKKVYFLPLRKARIRPKTYIEVKRILKENSDIRIVHSHFELYDIPARLMFPREVKVFWHLHDPIDINRKGNRALLERLQYKYLSKNVTLLSVAEKYRQDLIRAGFPQDRAFTLPNGIDLERIELNSNIDKDYDFLAYVWDFRRKGCDIIIKAANILIQKGYDFKVLLIGNSEAQTYIDDNYSDIKQYFSVRNAEQDINQLFKKARVFISASRAETFSYAVCEAAYAGLNVISSDIPGLEWAKQIPSIQYFESENPILLSEKMENFLNNASIDDPKISASRKIIEESFSVQHWCEQIVSYYGIL